ncbi:DUF2787 family protein [Aeromonas caviae]|uniref:DUF2787 family protein n=1 Tax=Aeromonas caviae TaxID=648 RepID=UPI0029D8197D|nr:DUF2787 family protein [Aeromonas caviae]MDX7871214.1 DUF2787 family protein [Aeromonas caviae]
MRVLLNQEVAKTELNIDRLTQLTFNFRNPGYSTEQGGVHPVEIRLIRGLDGWLFDYVTDFSYQGLDQNAELCKELDFNFLNGEHTMLGWGPLRLAEARGQSIAAMFFSRLTHAVSDTISAWVANNNQTI